MRTMRVAGGGAASGGALRKRSRKNAFNCCLCAGAVAILQAAGVVVRVGVCVAAHYGREDISQNRSLACSGCSYVDPSSKGHGSLALAPAGVNSAIVVSALAGTMPSMLLLCMCMCVCMCVCLYRLLSLASDAGVATTSSRRSQKSCHAP